MKDIRAEYERRKGRQEQLQEQLKAVRSRATRARRSLRRAEQAREIIREVGLLTQQELEFHVSDLVTSALEAVFPEPYTFVVEFIRQRNKTECLLQLERDGEKFHPLTSAGGGVIDIVAFALRVVSWSISQPRPRNTIILDEPFRFVSTEYLSAAGEMLKEISDRLNIQIIMVTHRGGLVEASDVVHRIGTT